MNVHYWYVDFGDLGDLFKVGVETDDRDGVEKYFQGMSNDVRWIKKEESTTKTKGRHIPGGIIKYCKHHSCKTDNSIWRRTGGVDADVRHHGGQTATDSSGD